VSGQIYSAIGHKSDYARVSKLFNKPISEIKKMCAWDAYEAISLDNVMNI
jgi:hypothetical protein